jgi:translocation and assembly module TamB
LRFFNKRRLLIAAGVLAIIIVAGIGTIIGYLRSEAFARRARQYIVQQIEDATGAKATLGNFDWDLWRERFLLEDLTLRGQEPADGEPLAHFRSIEARIKLRTLYDRRIDLTKLTVSQPEFHIWVRPDGTTNVPGPARKENKKPLDFSFAIRSFEIVAGSALINEQRIDMDFSLQNLSATGNYGARPEVLETHLSFDGVFDRVPNFKLSIPYTFTADTDYTRDTLVAQHLVVTSGQSEVKLQGKVSNLLSKQATGKLDYTAKAEVRFLNYFFTDERFSGKADAAGFMEFSDGYFLTQGRAAADDVALDGWRATKLTGEYSYRFPDRRLVFKDFKTSVLGGSAAGEVTVENLPGPSRVNLSVNYSGIHAADLSRAYPWDPKYRILSTAGGKLAGWFEGKFEQFEFSGHADLKSMQTPVSPGTIALPVDGSTDYQLRPSEARVANADLTLYSTAIKADGLIHARNSDLKVSVASSDLKDVSFLYAEANGSGSFDGRITGPIGKPVLAGQFTLQNHTYRQWNIQEAAGEVQLDTQSETAGLKNVRVTEGESQAVVNGTAALSGSPVDLRVDSTHVAGKDLQAYAKRNIEGVLAGNLHITSLTPNLRVEGNIRADNLSVDNRFIGNASGRIRYFDPVVELDDLAIQQDRSTLNGNVSFNRMTEALKFQSRVSGVDLQRFYGFGLPRSIEGTIRQATLQGDGTTSRPNIRGNATIQNLSAYGEVFPEARVDLSTQGSTLNAVLTTGRNITLSAHIDTTSTGYPFTAEASFNQYPLEHIAHWSDGAIIASGTANLAGSLANQSGIHGNGRIDKADIRVRQMDLHSTQPFTFDFDSSRLTLGAVTLGGTATMVNVKGRIGLTAAAPLDLTVNGQLDLGLIAAEYPQYTSSGTIDVQVNVGGTLQSPDIQGLATVNKANLSRSGLFTSIVDLNGRVNFDKDRITVSDFQGQVGGGTIKAQGTAQLQGGTVQAINIGLTANSVRLRGGVEGLRTVVNGDLVLRGTFASPLLEGSVQIQNLSYRSSFEDFLALLSEVNTKTAPAAFSNLRLSLHIEGGKNITIQNQLANVEARVDIDLKGTVDSPSITGHIEASGGTLTFQGSRYTVTRGNIDFIDPLRIQPVIDIEAESQIRNYRVILSVTGRGDKPKLSLRSDPPLPELEIVSLMAGGQTREEILQQREQAAGANGQRSAVPGLTSEQVFQSGAASILSDLLQQRVGNRLGILGGSKVRIEPFQVGAESNPGTRITLSQQVTKDLAITYSQDLSSNRQQVITVEYFVSRNTSVVATRDELGNLGLDVRHRTRIK